MARKIKKITKRATVSLFWLGAFLLSLIGSFVLGNSNPNLSKLNSQIKGLMSDSNAVSSAKADAPSGGGSDGCSSCAFSGGGSSDGGASAAATAACSSTCDGSGSGGSDGDGGSA